MYSVLLYVTDFRTLALSAAVAAIVDLPGTGHQASSHYTRRGVRRSGPVDENF